MRTFIAGFVVGLALALIVITVAVATGCSHDLPSRPMHEIDVQGHMPACAPGHEITYCGIFGPAYEPQCWVEGCDRG